MKKNSPLIRCKSKYTKKELTEIYTNYPYLHPWSEKIALEEYELIKSQQLLTEFVLKTIPIKKTIEELNKRFQSAEVISSDNDFSILTITSDASEINRIISFLDSFGYFPSKIDGIRFNNILLQKQVLYGKIENIKFEAKFDSEYIPNLDKKIYHISPDIYSTSIQVDGLTPKSQSKISTHPERIYFILDIWNNGKLKRFAEKLFIYKSTTPNKSNVTIEYYNVYEIDIKKCKNIKFYNDPQFIGEGVWTYQNIPPIAIKLIDKIKID